MIYLAKIEEINLLQKLYSKTVVTKEISEEYIDPLEKWIKVKEPKEKRYQKILEQQVDRGEASIMILGLETDNAVLCIDDRQARKMAKTLGLKLTGTLGVIYKAKQAGLIKSTRKTIEKLKNFDFRISEKIEREIIRKSGE